MKKNENIEIYKQDLVKSFHEQFAVNQNNHQSAFIQFLSIILSALFGFGYALLNFENDKSELNIELFEFTAIFLIVELVLVLGLALVMNYAYGFRRDQFVNTKIREKAGIIEDYENSYLAVFPNSFNHQKTFNKLDKRNYFNWQPNFHIIFTFVFIAIQIAIFLVYLLKICKENLICNCEPIDFPSLIVFVLCIISTIVISFIILKKYFNKIEKLYKTN